MDLIARYAERLIVMWNGRILLDGPTAEVFSRKEELLKTFLRPPVAAEVALALQPLGFPADVITPDNLTQALRRRAA
jgi:energy-coupling factor transport system ATP-binding protein